MVDVVLVALAESDCERWHAGWLAQPVNAVSSLAFVVVGAWLLLGARRVSAGRAGLIAGGVAMVGTGVGSLAYHGPQPGWAHVAHDGSALTLALLVAGRTIWQLVMPGTRRLALGAWRSVLPWAALAVTTYVAGRRGSPLCHPASMLQPHAVWHVLCAVTIGGLFAPSLRRHRIERAEAPVGG
jgi:hypothetical protein